MKNEKIEIEIEFPFEKKGVTSQVD